MAAGDDPTTAAPSLQRRASSSRTRRSQPSFSDLRLKPLSPAFQDTSHSNDDGKSDVHTDLPLSLNYQLKRSSSYILGKSAPPTLGPRRSDKHHHGGLSRKVSVDDDQDLPPAAVEDDSYFAYRGGLTDTDVDIDQDTGRRRNARSDAALLSHDPLSRSNAYTSPRPSSSHAINPAMATAADSWMTHAGAYTSALLNESKGKSWTNLHISSSNNLLSYPTLDSDNDDDPEKDNNNTNNKNEQQSSARLAATALGNSQRLASPWGSRFGSRAPSAQNSRRGSRAELALTPGLLTLTQPSPDKATTNLDSYRRRTSPSNVTDQLAAVRPDFINLHDQRDVAALASLNANMSTSFEGDEDEQEIVRLTQQSKFGLGGLMDRILGLGAGDVSSDNLVSMSTATSDHIQREREQGDMWADARVLFGLASKVLL